MQSETSCCYKSAAATLQRLYSLNGDIAVVLAGTGRDTFNVWEASGAATANAISTKGYDKPQSSI